MVIGLSVNKKIDSNVIIPNLNARNSLSDIIRSHEEERQKVNLNCHY